MLGRLMISLEGIRLLTSEIEFLANPNVGGVILFARNYTNTSQLTHLISSIRAVNKELLIAVDHEGGRVWRFRDGFTPIPAMKTLSTTYTVDIKNALTDAHSYGYTIASELRACDIDFSFTPVLDIDYEHSVVIGDRAFGTTPEVITTLSENLIRGLHEAGMVSVGKHYPGHGFAVADSHLELPVDSRTLEEMHNDISIYANLRNSLDAIMTAHILYPEFDEHIATFSKKWLTHLREDIGFNGIIFSDDLSMMGAKIIPDVAQRIHTAIDAGCDMILLCNDSDTICTALEHDYPKHTSLHTLRGKKVKDAKI